MQECECPALSATCTAFPPSSLPTPPSPNSPFLIACFFTQVYNEEHGDRQEPLGWINQTESAALLSIFLIEMQSAPLPPSLPFPICFSDVLTCGVPKFLFLQARRGAAMVAAKNFFIARNAGSECRLGTRGADEREKREREWFCLTNIPFRCGH